MNPVSKRQRFHVFSHMWKTDPKDKHKHDHIYIYTALMRLFDWTRGKRERKKE
jgi:hypothetical protein